MALPWILIFALVCGNAITLALLGLAGESGNLLHDLGLPGLLILIECAVILLAWRLFIAKPLTQLAAVLQAANPQESAPLAFSALTPCELLGMAETLRRAIASGRFSGRNTEELRKLNRAVEQSPASIVITDAKGDIVYVNPKFCDLTGYTVDEVLGRNPRILKTEHNPPGLYEDLWGTILRGEVWTGELCNRKKNGELFWERATLSAITNPEGEIEHFLAIKEDISARKATERALFESEQKYRRLVENLEGVYFFYRLDAAGNYTYVSPSIEGMLGYQPAACLTHYTRFVSRSEISSDACRYRELSLLGKRQPSFEMELLHRDSTSRLFEVSETPLFDEHGRPAGVEGLAHDITEQKRAESRLKRRMADEKQLTEISAELLTHSREIDRAIIGVLKRLCLYSKVEHGVIALYGEGRTTISVSHEWCAQGAEPQAALRQNMPADYFPFWDLELKAQREVNIPDVALLPPGRQEEREVLKAAGMKSALVLPLVHARELIGFFSLASIKETHRFNADSLVMLRMAAELFAGAFARRRDHAELTRREAYLRAILDNFPQSVWLKDRAGRFLAVNESLARYNNTTREAMLGLTSYDIWPRARAQKVTQDDAYVMRQAQRLMTEEQIEEKEGTLWYEVFKSPIFDTQGQVIGTTGYMRDITERKRAEEDLKASLSLLNASLESTADGILIVDREGRITKWNQKFCEMWAIPQDLLDSKFDAPVLSFVVDQMRYPDEFLSRVQDLYEHTNKESFDLLDLADGRVFERFSQPQRVGSEVVGRVWSFRDITERKRAEEALRESEGRVSMILASLQSAVIVIDPEQHRIVDANPVAFALIGLPREQIIGRSCHRFICPNGEGQCPITDKQMTVDRAERVLVNARGESVPILKSVTKAQLAGREYLIENFIDITERKRVEEALRASEALLKETQRIAGVGRWEYLVSERRFTWSEEVFVMHGLNPEDGIPDAERYLALLLPEDRNKIRNSFFELAMGNDSLTVELRLPQGDGSFRYLTSRANATKQDGRITKVTGSAMDITLRKRAELEVVQRDLLLDGVASALNYLLTDERFERAIDGALAKLGQAASGDRVYIFAIERSEENGEPLAYQRYEWVREGISPQIDNPLLQGLPFRPDLERWYDILCAGHILSGHIRDFPKHERDMLEEQDILSLIIVPIFINNELWGFIGFDFCLVERIWSESEQAILLAGAGSLGGFIQRKLVEEQLVASMKEMERVNRLMSGREQRVLELKARINALQIELGRAPLYTVPADLHALDDPETSETREQ